MQVSTAHSRTQRLQDWLATPAGQYLQAQQQALLEAALAGKVMQYLLHYGSDLVRPARERVRHVIRLGMQHPGSELLSEEAAWPVREHAADAVLLLNALECADSPHQLLREAARCVRPGGHLVMVGVNPWSLWGLRGRWCGPAEQRLHPLSPARLIDWLHLLGFALEHRQFGCYRPPLCMSRAGGCSRVEQVAQRLQLPGGGCYVLIACKRVAGLRPLPESRRAPRLPLRAVPVAKVGHQPDNLSRS